VNLLYSRATRVATPWRDPQNQTFIGGVTQVKTARFGLAVVWLALAAGPVLAGAPKNILPPEARTAPNGRDIDVLIGQSEIKSNINQSQVAVAAGGGLLAALVDAKIDSDRAKRAEAAIQPVRAALAGFDVDTLATDVSRSASEKLPWFHAAAVGFGRDTSPAGKLALLDASKSGEVAFFEYVYDLSPDFSGIRVQVTVSLAETATAADQKPASRIDGRHLAYVQSILTAVNLPSPSKDLHENAARWAADDGKLAKAAIAKAFADVGALLPTALELSADDAKAMMGKTHKFTAVGQYTGKAQDGTADGVLLFNGSYTHVLTLNP
jgi:hypothetical protein